MSWAAGMTKTGSLEESLSLASDRFPSALRFSISGWMALSMPGWMAVSMPEWMAVSMPVSMAVFEPGLAKRFTAMCENALALSMPGDCCCPSPGPVPGRRSQTAWRCCPRRMTRDKAARSMAGPESSESDTGIYHNG
jgi:hypothetical protein